MAWIVRLVSIGAEGEEHSTDVMRIARPGELTELASLGLTLAEGKQLLAGVQREIVAAQARIHAVRRPACRGCGGVCRVKDSVAVHLVRGLASPDELQANGALVWTSLFGAVSFEVFGQYGADTFRARDELFEHHLTVLAGVTGLGA